MARVGERAHYQVTFAVLAMGVAAFALLQSLVIPVLTSHLAPSGLPRESGYTTGFTVMTGGMVLAALAGLLIPSVRRLRRQAGEPGQAEMAMAADGAVVAGDTE